MKKALIKALLFAMTLVTLLTVIPLPANASTSNKQKVFSYLTEEMGLNSAAACGIMANIERESNFKASSVIRDSNGKKSGGLCQWNGGRFTSLQNYCNKKGLDYLSVEGQLSYLEHELNQDYYKHILNYLKKVKNTSDGAYDAAYYWCYYFEIPSSRATKSRQRGNTAVNSYWPVYGNIELNTPKISVSSEDVVLSSSVTLSWTSGGKDATSYKLYVAKKTEDGKYDWSNSKIYTTKKLKQKIDTSSLGEGSYAAKVKALNSDTGMSSDMSKTVKFTVSCKKHDFKVLKVTKKATLTSAGSQTVVCETCGAKDTQKLSKLTYKDVKKFTMSAPTASSRTDSSLTIKWSEYKGADGYRLYVRSGDEWKTVATVSGDQNSLLMSDLKAGTSYKLAIKFFVEKDGKRYFSKLSKAYTTSTATEAPTLKSVKGHSDGSADLTWTKVKGADMYAIYACTPMTNTDGYELICYAQGGNTTSFTVEGLKTGTYSFKVKAVVECNGQKVKSGSSNAKKTLVL